MNQHVPDILIEQYALGELSAEKARTVEQSPGFDERLRALEQSNAEILEQYPAETYVTRIRNQFNAEAARDRAAVQERQADRASTRRPLRWLAYALPSAAALAVGAILVFQGFFGGSAVPGEGDLDDVVRLKGSAPQLSVYRSIESADTRDDSAEELTDGSIARAGDRLQLEYNAGDRQYGAIISVDGRGAVFVHYPYTLSSEPELVVGRDQRLRVGYQLDDAPRFEHFYFITSQESFAVPQLVESIRAQANRVTERADSLGLDDKFEITSVTVLKGE